MILLQCGAENYRDMDWGRDAFLRAAAANCAKLNRNLLLTISCVDEAALQSAQLAWGSFGMHGTAGMEN